MKRYKNQQQHNCGKILEDELFENLKILPVKKIYTELELTELYGWGASSVDFLVEFDNITIFIQTKFLKSRRKENSYIRKFIDSIEYIKNKHEDCKKPIGLWVCRLHPFNDNEVLLNSKNSHVISCFESISDLVLKTIEYIDQTIII